MRTLLLLRHATASHGRGGLPDHERWLDPRGEDEARAIGDLVREADLVPDHVVTSTAVRARATALLCARAAGCDKAIEPRAELYGAGVAGYLEVLRGLPSTAVRPLLVGHNPTLETLVAALAGEPRSLPAGALAAFELDLAEWPDLDGGIPARLLNLWTP